MTTFVIHFHNLNIDEHWRQVVTMQHSTEKNSRVFFHRVLRRKEEDDKDDNENDNDEESVGKRRDDKV